MLVTALALLPLHDISQLLQLVWSSTLEIMVTEAQQQFLQLDLRKQKNSFASLQKLCIWPGNDPRLLKLSGHAPGIQGCPQANT